MYYIFLKHWCFFKGQFVPCLEITLQIFTVQDAWSLVLCNIENITVLCRSVGLEIFFTYILYCWINLNKIPPILLYVYLEPYIYRDVSENLENSAMCNRCFLKHQRIARQRRETMSMICIDDSRRTISQWGEKSCMHMNIDL